MKRRTIWYLGDRTLFCGLRLVVGWVIAPLNLIPSPHKSRLNFLGIRFIASSIHVVRWFVRRRASNERLGNDLHDIASKHTDLLLLLM